MGMTKKHYIAIAAILNNYYKVIGINATEKDILAGSLCKFFIEDNKLFNINKFLDAVNENGNKN